MNDSEQRFSKVVILLLVLSGAAGAAFAYRQIMAEIRTATHEPDLQIFGQVPHFTLTRQDRRPVTSEMMLKQVWVADFIFTRCAGPCPRMMRQMAELQDELADIDDLRFVTFTVDPEYDTPEVLERYARQYGADARRWFFLTGDRDRIRNLAIKGFKLAVGEDAEDEQLILHSTRFVLVDRKGRIRGYYDETDPEQMASLVADIQRLTGRTEH